MEEVFKVGDECCYINPLIFGQYIVITKIHNDNHHFDGMYTDGSTQNDGLLSKLVKTGRHYKYIEEIKHCMLEAEDTDKE